jgi:glycosyltransferase involved in cell wall biosynthesis
VNPRTILRFLGETIASWRRRRLLAAVARAAAGPRREDAPFSAAGLEDGSGVFAWSSDAGDVPGFAGVRKPPSLPALRRLLAFARAGGRIVYLPMFAGLPTAEEAPICAAAAHGTAEPAPHLLGMPHLRMVDGEFFPIARFAPLDVEKRWDFLIVTWAGSLREKRWDLVLPLAERLCVNHTMCIVAYKGRPTEAEAKRIRALEEAGRLTFVNEVVPKDKFPTLLNQCRVMIVPSEWDNKPRVMDQALLCNVPLVANANLYAGTNIVCERTGMLSPPDRLAEAAEEALGKSASFRNPRDWYLRHHGPYNAASRLADFFREAFGVRCRWIFPQELTILYQPEYIAAIRDLGVYARRSS